MGYLLATLASLLLMNWLGLSWRWLFGLSIVPADDHPDHPIPGQGVRGVGSRAGADAAHPHPGPCGQHKIAVWRLAPTAAPRIPRVNLPMAAAFGLGSRRGICVYHRRCGTTSSARRERPLVHIRTRICAGDPVPLKPAALLPSSATICRSGILKRLAECLHTTTAALAQDRYMGTGGSSSAAAVCSTDGLMCWSGWIATRFSALTSGP